MQQPEFRDVLWTAIEMADRDLEVGRTALFEELAPIRPELNRARFDEIVDMLVLSGHLRSWQPAMPHNDGSDILAPTAKARLQLSAIDG